jgi:hypothetical protein
MTGRGAGYCGGYDNPGWANPVPGRGLGLGWGRGGGGRGWRHRNWYHATGLPGWVRSGYGPAWGATASWAPGPYATVPSQEQETEVLKQQAQWLKQQLDSVSQRLEELEKRE